MQEADSLNFNKSDNLLSHVRKKSRGRYFQDMFVKFIREPCFFSILLYCAIIPRWGWISLHVTRWPLWLLPSITAGTTVSSIRRETIASLPSCWEWGDPSHELSICLHIWLESHHTFFPKPTSESERDCQKQPGFYHWVKCREVNI